MESKRRTVIKTTSWSIYIKIDWSFHPRRDVCYSREVLTAQLSVRSKHLGSKRGTKRSIRAWIKMHKRLSVHSRVNIISRLFKAVTYKYIWLFKMVFFWSRTKKISIVCFFCFRNGHCFRCLDQKIFPVR